VDRIATRVALLISLAPIIVVAQATKARKSIPTIAKAAKGAVVLVVMGNDEPTATGTGFAVLGWSTSSKDPFNVLIVTNYHVIAHGKFGAVKLSDGTTLPVDGVLAADKVRDLAVITVQAPSSRTIQMLHLGNSDRIEVGEEVVAIGNPLGLELSVSNGILSGVRADEKVGGKLLQITAPISHGSSGGPLFNMKGEVIGVTSMFIEGGENLNFAIPSNDVERVLGAACRYTAFVSDKPQALPNEPDLDVSAKSPTAAPKVIANERLRAFSECQMEPNRYAPSNRDLFHYPDECASLIKMDFKEWAIQQGLSYEAEKLARSEVDAYNRGLVSRTLSYDGDWSSLLYA
jgi:S1-C subfamily serine protease